MNATALGVEREYPGDNLRSQKVMAAGQQVALLHAVVTKVRARPSWPATTSWPRLIKVPAAIETRPPLVEAAAGLTGRRASAVATVGKGKAASGSAKSWFQPLAVTD